jgi:hypothetical protein
MNQGSMPTVTSTVQFAGLFAQVADLMKEYSFTIVTFLDIESGGYAPYGYAPYGYAPAAPVAPAATAAQ